MLKEREKFREKLVLLVLANEEDNIGGDASFPNSEEKKILRYYYYMNHGIDTAHVAPISDEILSK